MARLELITDQYKEKAFQRWIDLKTVLDSRLSNFDFTLKGVQVVAFCTAGYSLVFNQKRSPHNLLKLVYETSFQWVHYMW